METVTIYVKCKTCKGRGCTWQKDEVFKNGSFKDCPKCDGATEVPKEVSAEWYRKNEEWGRKELESVMRYFDEDVW